MLAKTVKVNKGGNHNGGAANAKQPAHDAGGQACYQKAKNLHYFNISRTNWLTSFPSAEGALAKTAFMTLPISLIEAAPTSWMVCWTRALISSGESSFGK